MFDFIKVEPASQSIILFKVIELWHRVDDIKHPNSWLFGIDRECDSGCIILELGFFGITLLRGDCKVV